jgi:LemA protein
LKASENFSGLHKTLMELENTLQYARRYYNAVVRDWNTLVEAFPSGLVARVAGFHEREYFQLDEAERAAPRLSFATQAPPASGSTPLEPGKTT